MKKVFRFALYFLLAAILLIQLYPRPTKNDGASDGPEDITHATEVPPQVMAILKTSCYDCHSNQTIYPWYASLQPVALMLNDHVVEGKKELNFSTFNSYAINKQYHKLEEIGEMVQEGEMPLSSYTVIHRNAVLSESQKQELLAWVGAARTAYQQKHSPETLIRKRN